MGRKYEINYPAMKNKMRIYCLALFLYATLTSCTKNDDVPTGALYKVIKNGYVTEEFSYNKNDLILEINSTSVHRKFYYDQNSKLTKEELRVKHDFTESDRYEFIDPQEIEISASILYEYDSTGKLIRKLTYLHNVNDSYLYTINTFEYDNEGLISKELFQFGEKPVSQTKTFLYDSNGNVKEEEMWLGPLHTRKTIEYDSFLNPYAIFKQTGSPGINTNKNNILKLSVFDYNPSQGLDSISGYQVSYEYNYESGYPTKVIRGEEYIYHK